MPSVKASTLRAAGSVKKNYSTRGSRQSGVPTLYRFASVVSKWNPILVLVAYAGMIAGYRRYLDASLGYIRPQILAAPEEILDFGFWVPWLLLTAWFAFACILSYRSGMQRKLWYWLPLLGAFGLLSVTDFFLYSLLERLVDAG
jgi:hypothetical protein